MNFQPPRMSNLNDPESNKPSESQPTTLSPPSGTGGVENPPPAAAVFGVPGILRRWRREDLLKRGSLALRGLGLLFSLLAFIIMASNQHKDWMRFDRFEEYRYVLAIAILSSLYTGLQSFRQIHELSTGKESFDRRNVALVDFFGDQLMAYLLISAASSAVPLTNRLRESADNIFTDQSAAAISMEFFAFLTLGLSAMISGYKLSHQSYI